MFTWVNNLNFKVNKYTHWFWLIFNIFEVAISCKYTFILYIWAKLKCLVELLKCLVELLLLGCWVCDV